jgi:hypothetical protein
MTKFSIIISQGGNTSHKEECNNITKIHGQRRMQKFMDKEECKNKQELCSVAGFTNEDPNKVPPYVGRFLLIEACDRHNRSHRVWIK